MTVFEKLSNNGIDLTPKDLEYIISKYNVKEISVFGSSIRNDFTSESDVDFLIDFRNSEEISLFDILDIQDYLQNITKRNVDIVEPAGLVNPYRLVPAETGLLSCPRKRRYDKKRRLKYSRIDFYSYLADFCIINGLEKGL